jgi:L-lactate dehydrogenase complex protein LldE
LHASQVHMLAEDCCGFGGIFSVEYAQLSTAILDQKLEAIHASGADIVTGCDVSCLMQIEGRLRRIGSPIRCAHMAELLIEQDLADCP